MGISQDDLQTTQLFARQTGLEFEILVDKEPYPVSSSYGIEFVPAVFILERDGRIAWSDYGFSREAFDRIASAVGGPAIAWPERIPSTRENAAVAFHYEEPKARAPQAMLLAVCPDDRKTWDDDLVTGILQEALELTKIRTVDLDSVQEVGQILPALYFALNLKGATISTNFAIAKEISSVSKFVR